MELGFEDFSFNMTMNQKDVDRLAWINRWKSARQALDSIENDELRRLTFEERQRQITALLDLADKFRRPRIDLGLVKLQAALSKVFGK